MRAFRSIRCFDLSNGSGGKCRDMVCEAVRLQSVIELSKRTRKGRATKLYHLGEWYSQRTLEGLGPRKEPKNWGEPTFLGRCGGSTANPCVGLPKAD